MRRVHPRSSDCGESEERLWGSARDELESAQLDTVRELIDAWIVDNPERAVVSLVRFEEFSDARKAQFERTARSSDGAVALGA